MSLLMYVLKAISVRLKREAVFRASFLFRVLGKASYVIVYYVFFNVFFGSVEGIGGWDKGVVFMLVGTSGLVLGFSQSLFGRGAVGLSELVRKGGVEMFLIKPLPAGLFMLFREPSISDLLSLPVSLMVLIHGMQMAPGRPPGSFFLYGLFLVVSVAIYSQLHLFLGLLAFKFVRLSAIFWWLSDFSDYARYPYRIFPVAFRIVFLHIIPVLALSNVPVMVYLGDYSLVAPFLAFPMFFAFLLRFLFRRALRWYEGTGTYELVEG